MSGLDELDALMASLAGPGSAPPPPPPSAPEPSARPASGTVSATDELDALMNQLDPARSSTKAAPAPAPMSSPKTFVAPMPAKSTPAYTPPPAAKTNTYVPPPAAKPSPSPAANKYGGSGPIAKNELDSMIGNLRDQMKNIDDGNVASRGICAKCKSPILGETMNALGKVWHVDHFICNQCSKPLGAATFYEVDGQPNCEGCYKLSFCPRCGHCDQPIVDRCISALGKKWHADHFICTACLQPFGNGTFFERDGKPYCEKDFYGTYAPRCNACGQGITSDCVNALGLQFHPNCFVCAYCHKAFGSEPFHEHQGKPYCETHYNQVAGSICAGCNKPLQGRVIAALGKKWHPEHFTCAFCMSALASNSYHETAGKAYCKTCHTKLFS